MGTIIAYLLVGRQLGADGSKVAAALCASYIGGSVNFAATANLLGLTAGPTMAAAMTADNIAMAAYLAVLYLLPAKAPDSPSDAAAAGVSEPGQVTSESLALAVAAAAVACSVGNAAASAVGFSSGGLAFAALAASALAALGAAAGRRFLATSSPFAGAEALGK